jgi:hypothetical protein
MGDPSPACCRGCRLSEALAADDVDEAEQECSSAREVLQSGPRTLTITSAAAITEAASGSTSTPAAA